MTAPPADRQAEPGWVEHAIWWHVYPLGFAGVDVHAGACTPDTTPYSTPGDGLRRVIDWLDYAVELGASGLALGPVFSSRTHGYDTLDHFTVDHRLGTEQDFDDLLAAAHARGLKVLLDGVFNHVSDRHPQFLAAVADPDGRSAEWFRLGRDGDRVTHADFEGHRDLVALAHDRPAVADLVVDVMTHWLGRGADGWRLDAAYAVPERFWATTLPRVREKYPDAYLVGEVIHGDYAGIVARTGLDSLTQYELWKAVWSALEDRNLFELAHALSRHDDLLAQFVPLTFVGNHDVTRLASRLSDPRHLAHALVVLFTTAGTPSIYYGDEQAFRGVKYDRAGGDDEVRPAFPGNPAELAPFGEPTYRLHQELIGLRRRHPWLHRARSRPVLLENRHLLLEVGTGPGRLAVALNLDDDARRHLLPTSGEVLAAGPGVTLTGTDLLVPGHGWAICSLH